MPPVGTITIPLYLGHMKSGQNVWYILTDVDDPGVAAELGLNFSAKMSFMGNAVRTANIDQNADLVFNAGTVDFSPNRSVTPGPSGSEFPPAAFAPGAIGDSNYSPYVQIANAGNVIYNAPIVAFNVNASDINFPNGNVDYTKVHDEVVAIDPINMTVTIQPDQRLQLRKAGLVHLNGCEHTLGGGDRTQHLRAFDGGPAFGR